jgi:hypothetical protein
MLYTCGIAPQTWSAFRLHQTLPDQPQIPAGLCWQEVASVADVETGFPREVAETFLRCKRDGFDQTNAIIELNALKIAEDRTFADCARYIFTTILGEL